MKSKGNSKLGNEHPGGAGRLYAFLIDVAGEDEGAADTIADLEKNMLRNPARNSTALTIVEVDRSTLADELLKAPEYRVVDRYIIYSEEQWLEKVAVKDPFWENVTSAPKIVLIGGDHAI